MHSARILSFAIFISIATVNLVTGFSARAETIEFSEDELATESVMPVFDKTVVVRERNVLTKGRLEVGGGVGLNLAEPLYDQTLFSLEAAYHFDEIKGMNLISMFLSSQLSNAGTQLKNGQGLASGNFDASLAPSVQNITMANYQFTAYYGKISITKDVVMNLALYGFGGLGMVKWTDSTDFGLDAGMGQKLYFSKNSALRFDLLLAIYQGPDPTHPNVNGGTLQAGSGQHSSSQFSSTTYFRPFMTISYVYLF